MGKSRCNTFLFYASQVHSSHLKVFKLRRLIFTLLISGCLKVGHRKHGRTIKPLNQCAVIDLNISATTQSKEPPNGWSRERRSVGLCAELLNATRAPHSHSLLFFRRPRGSTLGPRPCDGWWRRGRPEGVFFLFSRTAWPPWPCRRTLSLFHRTRRAGCRHRTPCSSFPARPRGRTPGGSEEGKVRGVGVCVCVCSPHDCPTCEMCGTLKSL